MFSTTIEEQDRDAWWHTALEVSPMIDEEKKRGDEIRRTFY
jgi:hypothetical protein